MNSERFFQNNLLEWHKKINKRKLPWKNESDVYKIWLSEIMLQQTQAESVIPYYEKFLIHFPNIQKLAKAETQFLFKLWEGLGYYNRCNNLLITAKNIAENFNGVFPRDYKTILSLKGIGPYTAAAIVSFAFNENYAVVDGNVYRILSRFFNLNIPIDTTEGKKQYQKLAQQLLIPKQAKIYNQAIMDFGASVCTPKKPLCNLCPLQNCCLAFEQDMVLLKPIKTKKTNIIERQLVYFYIQYQDKIFIKKRSEADIWKNLYEFVAYTESIKKSQLFIDKHFEVKQQKSISKIFTQKLTHQYLKIKIHFIQLQKPSLFLKENYLAVPQNELQNFAFPKALRDIIEFFK